MVMTRSLSDELLAEIKRLCAENVKTQRALQGVINSQLQKDRLAYRFSSSTPDPNSGGSIVARYNSVNSVRIRTIVIVFDTTIGALTLQLGSVTHVFPNNTFGYISLTECDYKLGNGDLIKLSAATWTAPKTLSIALAGEQVGDALWIA